MNIDTVSFDTDYKPVSLDNACAEIEVGRRQERGGTQNDLRKITLRATLAMVRRSYSAEIPFCLAKGPGPHWAVQI